MNDADRTAPITRRAVTAFIAGASGAASTLLAQDNQQRPGQRPSPGAWPRPLVPDTPAFEGPLGYTRGDVGLKAVPFSIGAVRLLPNSAYHDSQEWNRGYMGRLNAE